MKYLILLVVLLAACQPSENLEESTCVDRCLRIEGTILNGVTDEPMENLNLKVEYHGTLYSSGNDTKARTKTDANGFYAISLEVFDEEIEDDGVYELMFENDDKVFWLNGFMKSFSKRSSLVETNSTYTGDFLIHRPAQIKYDVDGLTKLNEGELFQLFLEYKYESINGKQTFIDGVWFPHGEDMDRGKIKVPAGVPILVTSTFKKVDGSRKTLIEETVGALEYNEDYEIEVDL